jgi:hypothetical protein
MTHDIVLSGDDVIEESETVDITKQDDVRPDDHQVAVNTAQELIRQRGILMEDLETALNACRRYRNILSRQGLPDPYSVVISNLLRKYKMDSTPPPPPPKEKKLPELPPVRRQLESGCTCHKEAGIEPHWHKPGCPERKAYY